jgi:hypothetical protein
MVQKDHEDPYLSEEQYDQLEYERKEITANIIDSNNGLRPKYDNGDGEKQKKPKPRETTAYKYSNDIDLVEEIQLDNKNVFLQIENGKPVILSEIDLTLEKDLLIRPHQRGEAAPCIPYTFRNTEEIQYFIDQARRESIHSLLAKAKSLWKHFVVAKDNDTIVLLAIDQVYSYFQDLFATTHYDIITGPPGSGKGAILSTMKALGYRVVLASDMTGANLLDIMGSVEACQVTIAEDEFDEIDSDRDEIKRKMYKVGYDTNGIVPRTLDGNTSARNNRWYYAYCFKICAAENAPDSRSLAGLSDRMFRLESIKSRPKYQIKTVLDQMQKPSSKQKPKYKKIISQIEYLRKLLLVYRLLHHNDIIEEVPLNIDGRAWELTSPQVFLFSSDRLASPDNEEVDSKPALNEVLNVLSRFLQKKGELAKKTLDGIVYDALAKDLLSDPDIQPDQVIDITGKSATIYTIPNECICDKVRDAMDGTLTTTPNEQAFYTTDYGKITHKRILKICRDRFSGEPVSTGSGKEKRRALSFDKKTVEKTGRTFEIAPEIKIIEDNEEQEQEQLRQEEGHKDSDGWDIPSSFPSRFRSTLTTQNHAQNGEVGTMGHKFSGTHKKTTKNEEKKQLDYISERENGKKQTPIPNHTRSPQISVPTSHGNIGPFKCYHTNCDFQTEDELDYQNHGALKHLKNPLLYPSKAEIEKYGLQPQGKQWER